MQIKVIYVLVLRSFASFVRLFAKQHRRCYARRSIRAHGKDINGRFVNPVKRACALAGLCGSFLRFPPIGGFVVLTTKHGLTGDARLECKWSARASRLSTYKAWGPQANVRAARNLDRTL